MTTNCAVLFERKLCFFYFRLAFQENAGDFFEHFKYQKNYEKCEKDKKNINADSVSVWNFQHL